MTAHDRKALLRAFYGLATLWIINGVFGLLRAAGPGALLPYIEIGLLFAYWAWVFNWWRKNKPKTQQAQAKRKPTKSKSTMTSDDIAAAVDREEAISRERNRRRKQRLLRSTGAIRDKASAAAFQLRFVFAGLALLFVITGGLYAYQEISKTLERQQAVRASTIAVAESKDRLARVLAVWNARNNCLVSELNLRWAEWYEQNPETRTVEYFSKTQLKWVKVTKTLPLPESFDDITRFIVNNIDRKTKYWPVSQSHFDPLVNVMKDDCILRWPPPDGMDEAAMYPDGLDFFGGGVPYDEQRYYQWSNPFPDNGFGW